MTMVSTVQEAQKDNIRSFNDYMIPVSEEDWRKEKRDFLQSLSLISTLPKNNVCDSSPEALTVHRNVSKKMSLILGARHHLEWGHEKYVMDTIQSYPAQAALGGAVGNLQRICAFLRIRLRDNGVLDFDADDFGRQPSIGTTWQQIYFCLRTGYYDDAREVVRTSRASQNFTPMLAEWISTGGMVSADTASAALEECAKLLQMTERVGRASFDKKELLLHVYYFWFEEAYRSIT